MEVDEETKKKEQEEKEKEEKEAKEAKEKEIKRDEPNFDMLKNPARVMKQQVFWHSGDL